MRTLPLALLVVFIAGCPTQPSTDDAQVARDAFVPDGGAHDAGIDAARADTGVDAGSVDANHGDASDFVDMGMDTGTALDSATDAATPSSDAGNDTTVDAPAPADGIAAARAAADGTGLTLPITNVTITYLKPPIGDLANDPAGFTVQSVQHGPALFIAVDPTTLIPAAAVGDVVSFSITTMATVGMQRRATAISGYTRSSTGVDAAGLAQEVSAATDLVSAEESYDSELVNLSGTLGAFAGSGTGFSRATLTTAGITGDTNFQFRAPTALIDALDIVATCGVTMHAVPVGRFNAAIEIPAFTPSDVTLTCPAPTVLSAVAASATSVVLTFSRNVDPGSIMAGGLQFTFDHGLTASAATVSGRTVTVTTSTQTMGTTYLATVAASLTDLQSTALGGTRTAMFLGFGAAAAVVRINEVNANIANACDLLELRVVSGGSMGGFRIQERGGASGELTFTFPSTFVVQTNDFIVIHESSGAALCNANGATAETSGPAAQPAATFAGNFDSAYDFWVADAGFVSTDNVFTLYDASSTIVDALFVSNDPAATATAGATETQAAAVGAASQWSPIMASYIDAVFRMNAADDLDATGTSAIGTSIQRTGDGDTNAKTDWTSGAGLAASWGTLNPGQVAF